MKLSAGTGTANKESALLRAIIDLITSEENTNWVSADLPPLVHKQTNKQTNKGNNLSFPSNSNFPLSLSKLCLIFFFFIFLLLLRKDKKHLSIILKRALINCSFFGGRARTIEDQRERGVLFACQVRLLSGLITNGAKLNICRRFLHALSILARTYDVTKWHTVGGATRSKSGRSYLTLRSPAGEGDSLRGKAALKRLA